MKIVMYPEFESSVILNVVKVPVIGEEIILKGEKSDKLYLVKMVRQIGYCFDVPDDAILIEVHVSFVCYLR